MINKKQKFVPENSTTVNKVYVDQAHHKLQHTVHYFVRLFTTFYFSKLLQLAEQWPMYQKYNQLGSWNLKGFVLNKQNIATKKDMPKDNKKSEKYFHSFS